MASNLFQTIAAIMTYSICHMKELIKPARPFVEVQVCKKPTKALYDSGADISCISDHEFRKIPVHLRPAKLASGSDRRFVGAGGETLDVRGVFILPISLLGRQVEHPFRVIRNLHEPVIIGADFINRQHLGYNPCTKEVHWAGPGEDNSEIRVSAVTVIPEFCSRAVPVRTGLDSRKFVVAEIFSEEWPHLLGGPGLVTTDNEGRCLVELRNTGPEPIFLERGQTIGLGEALLDGKVRELDPDVINAIAKREARSMTNSKQETGKIQKLKEALNLEVPDEFKKQYMDLLLKHHAAFSIDKSDLGYCDLLEHSLVMKTPEPVFIKQFKIPEAHQQYLHEQVREWLKLGIIQPSSSRFNSPLFLVEKKDGSYRVVQDFRALNQHTYVDKYSMKDVSECISEIGRAGSSIFTTLDLTSGFWQMALDAKSRPYTAFTVPGLGQFEWKVVSMGLSSGPSAYQRLVELVMKGLSQVIVYIDDIIIHSSTHEEHLKKLDEVLARLSKHNLKANLKKCSFGVSETMYLGFRLTKDGIVPGTDKLKAVKEAAPPSSIKQIRQFLGLCNFFRGHIQHFAQLTSPLTKLTTKEANWKGGQLPTEALRAFRNLQSLLCSQPVLAYPRRDRTYALITDASFGDEIAAGGLGAILAQVDQKGTFHVISYASRKLQKHEMNYTPFLLEMQAAIFGMETFDVHLRGRHFLLFTDHKPLEKLGKVHTKTLNRLQQMMNVFDFEIIYKKGSEMPADFLSRNAVDSIGLDLKEFSLEQDKDEHLRALRLFLLNRTLPNNDQLSKFVVRMSDSCFVQNGVVWKRLDKQHGFRPVLFAPPQLTERIISDAHGQELSGHFGILKTKEAILSSYFWINMEADISQHLKSCEKCQFTKPNRNSPQLLSPLPQCTEPNQRVHTDLFGPLKVVNGGKKYLLTITDSFTKYCELVVLPNKEAATVASALVNKWICRYGVPLEFCSDQGREYRNNLFSNIVKLLGTKHSTTSAYHPQCNSQAEVCNKTIAQYLSTMVDESTLNWEEFVPALMFCYNTSFHRSIKTSPFFLTHGIEPRTPAFFGSDIRNFLKDDHSTPLQRLAEARKLAVENNFQAIDDQKESFDKKADYRVFQPGQMVLLDEFNFLGKNKKLANKFSGPFKILRLKDDRNAEIVVNNGRKIVVNVQRLRPFLGFDVPPDDNDLASQRGGRGVVEVENDAADVVPKNDHLTNKIVKAHTHASREKETDTHTHTLPHSHGPLTRAKARGLQLEIETADQVQKNRPSMIQARLEKKAVEAVSAAVKRALARPKRGTVVSKKVKKFRTQLRHRVAEDPFKYGQGVEVSDSEDPIAAPAPANQNFYQAFLQWIQDFEQQPADSDVSFESLDDNPEDDDGQWVEQDDGWKSWKADDDDDDQIDWKTTTDHEVEDRCAKLFQQADDFERDYEREVIEAEDFLSEQELQRRQEEFRDKGLRLQRELRRARQAVSPDILDSARRRTPYSPRAVTDNPLLRTLSRKRAQGLKGRQLHFDDDDDDEEDDDRPIASRTRRHQARPGEGTSGQAKADQ